MATVGMNSTRFHSHSGVFTTNAVGVASLDTPELNQTKAEIRTLVAQIAELSNSSISTDEFLRGVLPRICTAMGASSAAAWQLDRQLKATLAGSHNLPAELGQEGDAKVAHERVLQCAATEGEPVLVPPGSIRIDAQRPENPLEDSCLIVPITIHNRVDWLLEVIQKAGGGPAAQRGYLRFVAQMGDLLADFLRRGRLRELSSRADYVEQLKEHLVQIASAKTQKVRSQHIVTAAANLLDADLAFLLAGRRGGWQVRSVSNALHFDPRSPLIQSVEMAMGEAERGEGFQRPIDLLKQSGELQSRELQSKTDSLVEMLGCEQLVRLSLSKENKYELLLSVDDSLGLTELTARASELIEPFASMLEADDARTSKWLNSGPRSQARSRTGYRAVWSRMERWIVRASCIGLVIAIALFPVPDHVSVVAVLEATQKQLYYAPAQAIVQRVLVDSHQSVKAGDTLLELSDTQLESRLDDLTGRRMTAVAQLAQDQSSLKRRHELTSLQTDELESRIEQLKITTRSLDEQLRILRLQSSQLQIIARSDAIVTSWDARNRLEGRPVVAGQLLLTACSEESPWRLQLSIPEGNTGYIQDALSKSPEGLPVRFSLNSHPDDVKTGRLIGLSKQLVKEETGTKKVLGTVLVDASTLPSKTEGAVVRAAVDCGRVAAAWLVFRDAYRVANAWVQMTLF